MEDKNDPIPEAEEYYDAEADQRVTITVSEERHERDQGRSQYSYYSQYRSTPTTDQSLGTRIKAGLVLRLIMLGFAFVTSLVVIFQCFNIALQTALTLVAMFKGGRPRRTLGRTIASAVVWTLITFSLMLGVILPTLGLGLAMMFLASLDLSSAIQRDLADRLREMRH